MFSLWIPPSGIRAQLNTSSWAPLCLAKFNMSTALLWQSRGLVIYWHQRMPMEKRNPPKLTFHFILQNKLMKCWKALTGWWIQSKRHLKWFIGWIYLASSRLLVFLRLHICLYSGCLLLSFAGIKWPLRRWMRKCEYLLIHMPNMQCFHQMFLLLLNAFMFLVFSFWPEKRRILKSWEINFCEISYEAKYVNSMTEDDIVTGIYVCWEITFLFPEKIYSDFWKQETERTNIILTTCS